MKRIVVFLFLLVLFFGFVSTDASNVKKIDLNLQDGEVDVVFIKLKTSNSILFIGDQNSNLFVSPAVIPFMIQAIIEIKKYDRITLEL